MLSVSRIDFGVGATHTNPFTPQETCVSSEMVDRRRQPMFVAQQNQPQLDLRRILRILRARFAWILLTFILVHFVILTVSLTAKPLYQSSAELVLESSGTESLASGIRARNETSSGTADRRQTEIQVLLGSGVDSLVKSKVKIPSAIRAVPLGGADVIVVTAKGNDARNTALTANAYATSYIEFRRSQAVADLEVAADRLETRLVLIRSRIADIDGKLADSAPATPIDRETATLEAERATLTGQRTTLQGQIEAFQIDAALRTGGADVNRAASIPTIPISPNPVRNLILGIPLGLFAGIGLALLRDAFDDTIGEREDVEQVEPSFPILGSVPSAGRRLPLFHVSGSPASPTAETFRSLRTAIQFLSIDRPVRTIQITSPLPGDGKTFVASSLAVSLTETGQRVALVDCDLRRSSMNEEFGWGSTNGLSSVLAGTAPMERVVTEVEIAPRLSIIPAGFAPPNPVELLASNRMHQVMSTLADSYDVVVADSPPLLPVADSLVLSNHADAVIMVIRVGKTTKRELRRAVELLSSVNAPLVGFVLNHTADEGHSYAGVAYQKPRKARRRWPVRQRSERSPFDRFSSELSEQETGRSLQDIAQ